jgi:hypothetical protein
MISQSPRDPIWIVRIQVAKSSTPSLILGSDMRPALQTTEYHPESDVTAHGPDATTAAAYVLQQNPGARVISATQEKLLPVTPEPTVQDASLISLMKLQFSAAKSSSAK